MKTILISLVLAFAGCAGMSGNQIASKAIALGGDAMQCAADDYNAVDDAIRNGGTNWIGAVIGLFQCIPQVVRDIGAKEQIADVRELLHRGEFDVLVADVAPQPGDPRYGKLSRGAARRLAVAAVLGALVNKAVQK